MLDKSAVPFHGLNLAEGWEPVPGAPPGIEQNVLSGSLDEVNGVGVRTRLIRFLPGAENPMELTHEYWEEVYLTEGELIIGADSFSPTSYACRPPGTPHGPFKSETGCIFFEIQYYAK